MAPPLAARSPRPGPLRLPTPPMEGHPPTSPPRPSPLLPKNSSLPPRHCRRRRQAPCPRSTPSTSIASLLLGSGRLPRFQFQSLRAPTKSPSSTRLRSCADARPHLLAPISASALPLRVTVAPSPVVEAEDDAGRAAAVRRVVVVVVCGALVVAWSHRALAVGVAAAGAGEGEGAGASGAVEAATGIGRMALRGSWPRVLQILQLLKEQGLILPALLGLSAFFSMAETSITTLWPWKSVPPAVLVRFLREHRSEWADYNIDAYLASALKTSACLLLGLRPMRFSGSQIIMPLAHTVENEEILEVVHLEGQPLTHDEALVSMDIHLLQCGLVWFISFLVLVGA